uniref:non-ribosomal peptide synthetase n=3 Tax=Actinoalloteichus cyanogriseus TaxID=2893586 RepID=UPI0012DC902F
VWTHRDPSRNPLVEVMVVLDNTPQRPITLPDLTAEEESLVSRHVSHDLSINFVERGEELRAVIGYSSALFDEETVERMAGRLAHLLSAVASAPHRALHEVSMIGVDEIRRLTLEWNGTAEPATADTIVAEFERTVRARPGDTALVTADGELPFSELNLRANRLAHFLVGEEIGPEDLVGVDCGRTSTTVVALLAVLKAGAAYLPLDPLLPSDRLASLIDQAGPALVLSQGGGGIAALASERGSRVVRLTDASTEAALAEAPGTDLNDSSRRAPLLPDNLAYIIYTSGSTGRPKGVAVRHHSLTNLLANHRERIFQPHRARTGHDRLRSAMISDFSFDASVDQLHVLIDGGVLHVVDEDTRRSSDALLRYLVERDIDTVNLTPTHATQLLPVGLGTLPTRRPLALLLGGEPILPDLWRALRELPRHHTHNLYGPTECTVETVSCSVSDYDRPALGRPQRNTDVHVLDAALRPSPVGVAGELYIGGLPLSRGYWRDPVRTAERFVANPFDGGGSRLYRSGDRVRWLDNGALEYLDRVDDQVKIRGFRVELGEVESALLGCEGVSRAAATVLAGGAGPARLVGYVVPVEPALPPGEERLRASVAERLPSYMVPVRIVVVDTFPVTASGKVDRRALPEPEGGASVLEAHSAPRDEVERLLAEAWEHTLGVGRVGRHDNFFQVGGDSILSIQLVSQIRKRGLRVVSKDVFLAPTIGELAERVRGREGNEAEAGYSVPSGPLPLTPVQRDFLASRPRRPEHFVQSTLLELRDGVDVAALQVALDALLRWHEALRWRFTEIDGEWTARVEPYSRQRVPLEPYDLRGVSAGRRRRMESVATEVNGSLSLADGPLFRALLFRSGPEERDALLLTTHHLVSDAVSQGILLEDLDTAYGLAVRGEPVVLGSTGTSFASWAGVLADQVRRGTFDEDLGHWAGLAPAGEPRVDGAREVTRDSATSTTFSLSPGETDALVRRASSAFRSSTRDVLLTAFGWALGRLCDGEDVEVELEGHGREEFVDGVDLSRTVGWFTTIYPVLLTAGRESTPDWAAAVRSTRRRLRSVPNRGLSFGALRHYSTDPRAAELADRPRPRVLFAYHGHLDTERNSASSHLYRRVLEPVGADLDSAERMPHLVDVVAVAADGVLRFDVHYSTEAHRPESIHAFTEDFRAALGALARRVDPALSERGA